jgi:hypothetical protein
LRRVCEEFTFERSWQSGKFAQSTNKEIVMDFIERLFGLSPDNGDGSTELMYFIGFVAIALAVAWVYAKKGVRHHPDR